MPNPLKSRDPKTPEEWQEAVDAAAAWRMIADCIMYGLLAGGPKINIQRCDDLLQRGAAKGITPSRPAVKLAIGFIEAVNSQE